MFAEPGRFVLAAAASSHEMVLGACGPAAACSGKPRPPEHGLLQAGVQAWHSLAPLLPVT